MNEEQILSEYIDGELAPELATRVEQRLARDPGFRARHDRLVAVRRRLAAVPDVPAEQLAGAQSRVWQKLQRNLSPRPSRIPHWVAAIGDILGSRVSLPVPAMAGLAVLFVAVAMVAAFRPGTTVTAPSVAGGQAVMSIPSLGQRGVAVDQMGITPAALSVSSGTVLPNTGFLPNGTASQTGSGLAVTIEVQNLRQLLSVLENSEGIRELSIQLPQQQTLEPLGEPALLSASELAKQGTAGAGK